MEPDISDAKFLQCSSGSWSKTDEPQPKFAACGSVSFVGIWRWTPTRKTTVASCDFTTQLLPFFLLLLLLCIHPQLHVWIQTPLPPKLTERPFDFSFSVIMQPLGNELFVWFYLFLLCMQECKYCTDTSTAASEEEGKWLNTVWVPADRVLHCQMKWTFLIEGKGLLLFCVFLSLVLWDNRTQSALSDAVKRYAYVGFFSLMWVFFSFLGLWELGMLKHDNTAGLLSWRSSSCGPASLSKVLFSSKNCQLMTGPTGRQQEAPDHKATARKRRLDSDFLTHVLSHHMRPRCFCRFGLHLCVYFQPISTVRSVRQTETDSAGCDCWLKGSFLTALMFLMFDLLATNEAYVMSQVIVAASKTGLAGVF